MTTSILFERRVLTAILFVLWLASIPLSAILISMDNTVINMALIGAVPAVGLILYGKRWALPGYIVVAIFLTIVPWLLNPQASGGQRILGYSGTLGRGASIGAVVGLVFLLVGGVFLLDVVFYRPSRIRDYFANPGVRWLFAFGVMVLIALLIQSWVGGHPLTWMFRKGRGWIVLVILSMLLWLLFDREGDEWRIFWFSLTLFVVFASSLALLTGSGKFISRGGEMIYRFQFALLAGNGTASYFSMYVPLLVLAARRARGLKRSFFMSVAAIALILALLASTRATYIALALCIPMWWWLEKGSVGLIQSVLLLVIVIGVAWSTLSALFVADLATQSNTLESRIDKTLVPGATLLYSTDAKWYGFPLTTQGQYAGLTDDVRFDQNHNMLTDIAIGYGLPAMLCWLGFWIASIVTSVRRIRTYPLRSAPTRQLAIACTVSLSMYFVNAQAAPIMGTVYILPVFLHFYILQKSCRNLRESSCRTENDARP